MTVFCANYSKQIKFQIPGVEGILSCVQMVGCSIPRCDRAKSLKRVLTGPLLKLSDRCLCFGRLEMTLKRVTCVTKGVALTVQWS